MISEKEKKITAFHEAGHAILFHVLPDVGPVYTVSIIPTGVGAAGYTMPLPERDDMFMTKGRMLQDIMVDLGGRIAEELIFDDITTGASNDIAQAPKLARAMVTRYGMSERFGMVALETVSNQYLGGDASLACSQETATLIDREVVSIVQQAHDKAREILKADTDALHRLAKYLLEKETITGEEFMSLLESGAQNGGN